MQLRAPPARALAPRARAAAVRATPPSSTGGGGCGCGDAPKPKPAPPSFVSPFGHPVPDMTRSDFEAAVAATPARRDEGEGERVVDVSAILRRDFDPDDPDNDLDAYIV